MQLGKGKYPITGTYIDEITVDIPSANWGKKEWVKDLRLMKSVGIDTIIFIRGGLNGKCLYPSEKLPTLAKKDEDYLEFMLAQADKLGLNAYIGLYKTTENWDNGDYKKLLELNEIFIEELKQKYIQHKSFVGYFLSLEVGCNELNIIPALNGITEIIKRKTPDKKVYYCPLFRTRILEPIQNELTPEQTAKEWDFILKDCGKDIDYISFTDGTAPVELYGEYLTAIKPVLDKYGIELWANTESFGRDVRNLFYPAPFQELRQRIEIAEPHVTKMVTFEFSHFLSPQSMYPTAKNLFKRYKEYYGKKHQ